MKTKKVIHIFPSFNLGGSQKRTCDIINETSDEFEHCVIAMDNEHGAIDKIEKKSAVRFIQFEENKKNTLNSVVRYRNMLKKINPDLMITYNWGTIEWELANLFPRMVPSIHIEDGFNPDEIEGQKFRRKLARRIFLARTDKLVVPSETLRRIALNDWKIPERKIKYIPNGIDVEKYVPKEKKGNEIIIGTIARLSKEKNIPRMIKIFAEISNRTNCKLVIAGEGKERDNIEKAIRSNNLKAEAEMVGYVDKPWEILSEWDIFLMTSDTEQMPYSVIEAMAAGLPVVSTDVGDVKNMVSEENRQFIVNKNNNELLIEPLEALINNSELREKLGNLNREKCKKLYSKDRMIEAYRDLFLETINR